MNKFFTLIPFFLTAGLAAMVPTKATNVNPIEVGAEIPAVDLLTVEGAPVRLADAVEGPKVIVFYRGSWCPYCNRHLSALAEVETEIEDLGYSILAISPDKPEGLKEAMEKNELHYTLLSDSTAATAKAFGLAFEVDAKTRDKYKGYGIDLEKASGNDHHLLPVPAVYVVNAEGIITFRYYNPDYSERLGPKELLKALK